MEQEWFNTAKLRSYVHLDLHIVMPNHLHGIICLVEEKKVNDKVDSHEERFGKPVAGSLPTIVRAFKSAVTRRYHLAKGGAANPLWQRNYYEHGIRNEEDWRRVRNYIIQNPVKWDERRDTPTGLWL